MQFRRSEWVLLSYFGYATVLALVRPIALELRLRIVFANLVLGALYVVLARGRRERVRDWIPYPLVLLAYKEMGWLAVPHSGTALEESWIGWDRLLLDTWGARAAIESLGPVIPNLLEVSYLLVYAVPAYAVAVFYRERQASRLDDFYVVLLVGTLGTYALYPYFPSEPPRTVFPGQDLPTMVTHVRKVNLYFVNGYGIHTSVFPSGHVAAAFSAAFGLWLALREQRKQAIGLTVLAAVIAVATVYGRYHYAVDAVGGFLMAVLAYGVAAYLRAWRGAARPAGAERYD
jgi:membrane-associated phospholipid phosphatase